MANVTGTPTCSINRPFYGASAVQRIPNNPDAVCIAPCDDNGGQIIAYINETFKGMCFYKNDDNEDDAINTLDKCAEKYATCVTTRDGIGTLAYHTFYSKYPCWENCNDTPDKYQCQDGPTGLLLADKDAAEQVCDFDPTLIATLSKPNSNWNPPGSKKCDHCACDNSRNECSLPPLKGAQRVFAGQSSSR
jgi:hypothetical protein